MTSESPDLKGTVNGVGLDLRACFDHALLEVHCTTYFLSIWKGLEMAPKIKFKGINRATP
jgi:hypothetical protein